MHRGHLALGMAIQAIFLWRGSVNIGRKQTQPAYNWPLMSVFTPAFVATQRKTECHLVLEEGDLGVEKTHLSIGGKWEMGVGGGSNTQLTVPLTRFPKQVMGA